MYFFFLLCLSHLQTKNNIKNTNKQDQRGDFVEKQALSKQDQIDKPTHLLHHFSLSFPPISSLSQTQIYPFVSLHRKSIWVVDLGKLADLTLSHLLSSMVALMRPISHHSENLDRPPLSLLHGFSFSFSFFPFGLWV